MLLQVTIFGFVAGLANFAGAGLVLLFNSASIVAMLTHYSEDRSHIYGLDLHYLDEMKKSRG